jgi:uncharacterized protein (DUF2235 family)
MGCDGSVVDQGVIIMRRLIVCCDGTWNTPDQIAVTNVRRLYHALDDTDQRENEQLVYYQSGVGTGGGDLLGWLSGGVAGVGLSQNVMDAYRWLSTTYRHEDRIALFGFSRGAYTARSLAGMIAACGLLDTSGQDEALTSDQVRHAYQRRYRQRSTDPAWRDGLRFSHDPDRAADIPVDFIGVWDTVGSLGIPDSMGWLNLLDPARRFAFHDVRLNPYVQHARHAVALDERRGPFTPTLWDDTASRDDQDVKQVWFPGSHMDVGGGHRERGLSDGTLLWMVQEARAAVALGFRKDMTDQIRPDAQDVAHDDNQGIYGLLEPLYEPLIRPALESLFEPRPRATPVLEESNHALHPSVHERHKNPPIGSGPYRPTTILEPGQSSTVEVYADRPWNWTGLYLQAGVDYTFTARGLWTDLTIPSGPDGVTGRRRFRPVEAARLAGSALGLGERLFRRVTGNPRANFLLTRREEQMPWMSLVGVVANDAVTTPGAPDAHESLAIGAGADHRVCRDGYLYAFANDAWSLYGNNRGMVRLTVTRKA